MVKTKAKTKKEKKPSSAKTGKLHFRGPSKSVAGLMVLLIFVFLLAATFVPVDYVPESLVEVHAKLLGARNSIVAKSGLKISRYEDSALVDSAGAAPVKLYFAPSPKISEALCNFLATARDSIDMCIYDLDLADVTDALKTAYSRGVRIRIVTDDTNMQLASIRALEKLGVPVRNDERPAIMHHKFVIVDGTRVWTGSFNFTDNCALKNDNNALVLESPELAAAYLEKFNEYWSGHFGPNAKKITTNGKTLYGKIPVEVAFSPSDRIQKKILDELTFAKKSVDVMAFSFTSQEIADKLRELAKKGLRIRCLFDASQAGSAFSQDDSLKGSGVQFRLSPNRSGRMHHKVIVIDDEIVLTGSYNFSKNADNYNDENILILRNAGLAQKYEDEFQRCWYGSKGY